MNPSTALAQVIVDELVRHGISDAVVAPGSRSAPLAMVLHAADLAGHLRLHVRVDERSAGFLALGLAKGSHRPVPVVTTSGTAVANLHPAVLEARHAGVPLLVISADRPAELRGSGANQTTDQVKLFGDAVGLFVELPAPEVVPSSAAVWRSQVSRLVAAATGTNPGPVHMNVCLRDPLLPDGEALPTSLAGRPGDEPWTAVAPAARAVPTVLGLGPRTVVVAGDDAGPPARILAQNADWPLLAEPSSGARTGTHPIAAYRLLLAHPDLGGAVERVVVFGHPTLSRPVSRLVTRDDVEVVVVSRRTPWPDLGHASSVVPAADVASADDPAWRQRWTDADAVAGKAIEGVLGDGLTPQRVARIVSESLPPEGLLVVGSSSPIRDLDLMAVAHPVGERRMVMANRGLSGIDGVVSTAVGAALGRMSFRSLAYMGDLTFVHDSNGLVIGPGEPRPDLTIVVPNDDGGSIFATLEQGAPAHGASFERVFGTPLRFGIEALCEAVGVSYVRATDPDALRDVLARTPAGLEVVEAGIDRAGRRQLDERIRAAVERALSG